MRHWICVYGDYREADGNLIHISFKNVCFKILIYCNCKKVSFFFNKQIIIMMNKCLNVFKRILSDEIE